ncbi:MAG: pyrroline-5-carboxylate reductase [Candidatus Methanomethylophilaceae archaeon]
MTVKIGFIGAGQMASALMKGIISKGLYSKDEVIACDVWAPAREKATNELGIKVYEDAIDVVRQTKFLVLAVKPQQIESIFVSKEVKLGRDHILMSIAAGVKIDTLESYVPDCKIIRVMPNFCCTVLASASCYALGSKAETKDGDAVKAVLEAVGIAFEVKEKDLDAVTGLSGSAPAYMFMVIDALADGGVLMGLPRDMSIKLAAQTMLGAAKTVLETGKHPAQLKDSVCSPAGTTIEGVRVLEEYSMRGAFISAVQAGTEKSKELGGKS